ncbi:hypothetical protein G8O24_10105 [Bradyrhizobium sp. INPA01-394B]|uniref:Uncharacterized protein n=1 Tax=Bradyrhizobium campsiandrae TaxID=1729892 RepID=A0ABR7U3S5_9BRAD|nr:hypothetical protein [Bradyrhizobium campsiandrae]MBC9877692.1 hypothetical protein [Bradyrhizobium campsiandrae]MBC9978223.1 hypothetical protein [Bradyrhizobium campsiandrae]
MRYALLLIATLLSAVPTWAEEYEKGPNGGLMLDVAGVDAELLTTEKTVTINVFDAKNGKPIATKGYSGAVLIAGGSGRETVTLAPQGENSLMGDAKTPIAAGTTITLTIKTAEGKSGQAKFKE